jgi:hypothetical protein
MGKTPVTPVVSGSPVQLVKVPEVGVPKSGVVNATLVWMFALETDPAVFGMAFKTELTKKDSTVTRFPDEAPVVKTTVVPLVAV